MEFNKTQAVSLSEVEQSFSRAREVADREGSAVIYNGDKPCYVLVNLFDPEFELSDDQKVDAVAKYMFYKYRKAFKELAE